MSELSPALYRYELLEKIGVGGMAEVFKARAIPAVGPSRTVVVKRILPDFSEDANFRTMFVDEGRIVSLLDHPNVVRLLDIGRLDDQLFLAMEYVDGIDLLRTERRSRRPTTRRSGSGRSPAERRCRRFPATSSRCSRSRFPPMAGTSFPEAQTRRSASGSSADPRL